MNTFLQTIQAAVALDATPEQKQAGAAACRAILASLEGAPGHTLALPSPTTPRLTIDQVLEIVIAKLQAMLPGEHTAPSTRFTVPTVALRTPSEITR